jgi:cell division protein FtsB
MREEEIPSESIAERVRDKTPHEIQQEEIESLKARVAALEAIAHNTHSIPQETIDVIARQAVQQIGKYLRTTCDILSVLEREK